jgi:hypothetical protein
MVIGKKSKEPWAMFTNHYNCAHKHIHHGHMQWLYDHGQGLSPSPTSRQYKIHVNLKPMIHTYITRNKRWRNGRVEVVKDLYSGEVWGSNPADSHNILHTTNNQTMSDTWCPQIGPSVLIPFANKRTRVIS